MRKVWFSCAITAVTVATMLAGCSYGRLDGAAGVDSLMRKAVQPSREQRDEPVQCDVYGPASSPMATPRSLRNPVRQTPIQKSFVVSRHTSEPMVYISDENQNAIFGFDKAGNNTITISGNGLDCPGGLFVDGSQNLWVANSKASNVLAFAKNGTSPIRVLSDPREFPMDVTICPNGTIYVSNIAGQGSGSKGSPGSISIYANGNNSPTGRLQDPNEYFNLGLTCDKKNNVFTGIFNQSISGEVDEYIGGKQSRLVTLPIPAEDPESIKPDNAGNLLVDDVNAFTVTEYTEAGVPTGRVISVGDGDFCGIAVSRKGNLVLGASSNFGNAESFEFPSGQGRKIYYMPGSPFPVGTAYDPGQRGF